MQHALQFKMSCARPQRWSERWRRRSSSVGSRISPILDWSLRGETRAGADAPLQALDARWLARAAAALADRGLAVVGMGSPDEAEPSHLDHLWNGTASVRRLNGRSRPEVAALRRPPASRLVQTRPSRILPRRRVVRLLALRAD